MTYADFASGVRVDDRESARHGRRMRFAISISQFVADGQFNPRAFPRTPCAR
jgi:hypothetical protein